MNHLYYAKHKTMKKNGKTLFSGEKTWLLAKTIALVIAIVCMNSVKGQTFKSIAVPNNTITTCVSDGSNTYIGGNFTQLFTPKQYVARFDRTTGKVDNSFLTFNGQIDVMITDGNNGWYIGGAFTQIGSVACNHLAHILSDGTVDKTWKPISSGDVYTIVKGDSNCFYIGGNFNTINEVSHRGIAKIKSDGTLSNWNVTLSTYGYVNSIVIGDSNSIYIGGYFSTVNGLARSHLAKIRYDGTLAAWNPGASSSVFTLMVGDSSHIYVGGMFNTIGGLARSYIAKIKPDGSVAAWNPSANSFVRTIIKTDNSCVEIGGNFTTVGGTTRYHTAKINPDGTLADFDIQFSTGSLMYANSIEYFDNKLYIAGNFDGIGHSLRSNIACIGSSGEAESWNPGCSGPVNFIKVSDKYVYASGSFYGVNPFSCNYLAKIKEDGNVDTNWNLNISVVPSALAIDNSGNLFVGGSFTSIGGQSINRLAKVSSAGVVDATWNPNPNSTVQCLALGDSSYLYVGGIFSSIGGINMNYLCKIKTTDASVSSWNPSMSNFSPNKLVFDRKKYLYVSTSGTFTINGATRKGLARFLPNGSLDNNWAVDVVGNGNSGINGLAPDRYQNLYLCGSYWTINTISANLFTRVSPSLEVNSMSVNNYMYTLAADSAGCVYVGGTGGNIGYCASNLARFKPNSTIDCNWKAGVSLGSTVRTIASDKKGNVYAGIDDSPYLRKIYTPYITGNTEIDGVTLTYTDVDGNKQTVESDSTDYYYISTVDGLSTTVTPSKEGYDFTPVSRTYTSIDGVKINQDFKASVAIAPSPDSISFGQVKLDSTSDEQSFTVYCLKTDSALTITPPRYFQISQTSGSGFQSSSLKISPVNGQIPVTTIYVRFLPTKARELNSKIALSIYGLNSKSVIVHGIGQGKTTTISWEEQDTITYGTLLSSTQLNAKAEMEGTFFYFPAAGTLLEAHDYDQLLEVIFTPTDTLYNEVYGINFIWVNKALLTVTANDQRKQPGEANPELTLSYSGFVKSDNESVLDEVPTATTDATIDSPEGTYTITVSGGSDNNYVFAYVNGILNVSINSISEANKENIKVFPNPTSDMVTIINQSGENGIYTFYSLTGKVLIQGTIDNSSEQVSLNNFPAGIFILKVTTDNSVYTCRIIKR